MINTSTVKLSVTCDPKNYVAACRPALSTDQRRILRYFQKSDGKRPRAALRRNIRVLYEMILSDEIAVGAVVQVQISLSRSLSLSLML